jgi:hypothetical protein
VRLWVVSKYISSVDHGKLADLARRHTISTHSTFTYLVHLFFKTPSMSCRFAPDFEIAPGVIYSQFNSSFDDHVICPATYLRPDPGGALLPWLYTLFLLLFHLPACIMRAVRWESAQYLALGLAWVNIAVTIQAYVSTRLDPAKVLVWMPLTLMLDIGAMLQMVVLILEMEGHSMAELAGAVIEQTKRIAEVIKDGFRNSDRRAGHVYERVGESERSGWNSCFTFLQSHAPLIKWFRKGPTPQNEQPKQDEDKAMMSGGVGRVRRDAANPTSDVNVPTASNASIAANTASDTNLPATTNASTSANTVSDTNLPATTNASTSAITAFDKNVPVATSASTPVNERSDVTSTNTPPNIPPITDETTGADRLTGTKEKSPGNPSILEDGIALKEKPKRWTLVKHAFVALFALFFGLVLLALQIWGLVAAQSGLKKRDLTVNWCSPTFRDFALAITTGNCERYSIIDSSSNGIGCVQLPASQQEEWLKGTVGALSISLLCEAIDLFLVRFVKKEDKEGNPIEARGTRLRRPWCSLFLGPLVFVILIYHGASAANDLPPGVTDLVWIYRKEPMAEAGRVCQAHLRSPGLRGMIIGWTDGLFDSWGTLYHGKVVSKLTSRNL